MLKETPPHRTNGRRRLLRALVPAAVSVIASICGAHEPAVRSAMASLFSKSDTELIEFVGITRPCAATALVYTRGMWAAQHRGALQLEGVPSTDSLATLFDTKGERGSRYSALALPRGPYSEATVFVEIRWSLDTLGGDSFLLTTEAHLVDASGSDLVPSHELEPRTTLLVAHGSIHTVPTRMDF